MHGCFGRHAHFVLALCASHSQPFGTHLNVSSLVFCVRKNANSSDLVAPLLSHLPRSKCALQDGPSLQLPRLWTKLLLVAKDYDIRRCDAEQRRSLGTKLSLQPWHKST